LLELRSAKAFYYTNEVTHKEKDGTLTKDTVASWRVDAEIYAIPPDSTTAVVFPVHRVRPRLLYPVGEEEGEAQPLYFCSLSAFDGGGIEVTPNELIVRGAGLFRLSQFYQTSPLSSRPKLAVLSLRFEATTGGTRHLEVTLLPSDEPGEWGTGWSYQTAVAEGEHCQTGGRSPALGGGAV
jgi:hypothetical protein